MGPCGCWTGRLPASHAAVVISITSWQWIESHGIIYQPIHNFMLSWSNITWCCNQDYIELSRMSLYRLWTQYRHPTYHTKGWYMGCLYWVDSLYNTGFPQLLKNHWNLDLFQYNGKIKVLEICKNEKNHAKTIEFWNMHSIGQIHGWIHAYYICIIYWYTIQQIRYEAF